METLWIILILLVATRLCGAIALKAKQPVLVGEIVAGVALGIIIGELGSDIPILDLSSNHHFMALSDLGIFFIMLLGGVEMRPRELVESSFTSMIVATSAMAVPLTGGFTLAWFFLPETDLRFAQSLFVGTALAITAVPVTIKVLMDMGLLRTRIGKLIVSAAVFDDLLSLILLSVLTAILNTGSLPGSYELFMIFVQVLFFLGFVFIFGKFAMPPIARFLDSLGVEEMDFSFLLVMGMIYAVVAELLGLHFMLGAFAAGLFFGRKTINQEVYDDLHKKVTAITTGFLAPIFFASIGFELDLTAVTEVPLFLSALVGIAFLGKLVGAAIPAMMLGIARRDAWAVGTAMSARGAVELIIAGIALRAGLFDYEGSSSPIIDNLFSSIVIVAIVTTLIAPIGLRMILTIRAENN
ncbi:MAG: cation:proton antiporter [Proteobacteria bacterium]|nr:cation:proton antiporter [Pseudomonadota bacterium]NOG60354.1 cation:proton antiporter [Pseudomonadota bacterium]